MLAAQNGHITVVDTLLQHGASVHMKTPVSVLGRLTELSPLYGTYQIYEMIQ